MWLFSNLTVRALQVRHCTKSQAVLSILRFHLKLNRIVVGLSLVPLTRLQRPEYDDMACSPYFRFPARYLAFGSASPRCDASPEALAARRTVFCCAAGWRTMKVRSTAFMRV